MRHRLARIVIQVGQTPRPGELRSLLADALGDETLELLYAVDERWIDATGAEHSLPDESARGVTSLVQNGVVVAVLVHRAGVLDDSRLVEEIGRAARLALDHDRLQAQLHRRLAQLRETRMNFVIASDRERQRLERDLHDGAQQGLASLAMAIGLARAGGDDPPSAALAPAQAAVRGALEEVRAIAHGIYPAALADAGLEAALDVLAEWSADLQVGEVTNQRFDPVVESTAYFIVDSLTRQRSAPLTANLRHDDNRLIVEVTSAEPLELATIADRVGALDGRLEVAVDVHRRTTTVRAELPCG
jgi:signal transduction histidine kinase